MRVQVRSQSSSCFLVSVSTHFGFHTSLPRVTIKAFQKQACTHMSASHDLPCWRAHLSRYCGSVCVCSNVCLVWKGRTQQDEHQGEHRLHKMSSNGGSNWIMSNWQHERAKATALCAHWIRTRQQMRNREAVPDSLGGGAWPFSKCCSAVCLCVQCLLCVCFVCALCKAVCVCVCVCACACLTSVWFRKAEHSRPNTKLNIWSLCG